MGRTKLAAIVIALGTFVCHSTLVRAQQATPVAVDGTRIFPESLDAGADGTLYIGSIGQGAVFRALPGAGKATLWLEKSTNKLSAVLGVLADDAHGRLWVCSSDLNRLGEPVSLKSFDIKSGALTGNYPFIDNKGLCNDIVVTKDGTAYATDTANARVFRLKPGATALEIWASDPRFDGADGITLWPNGDILIGNVRTGLLFRIAMKPDGSAGAITQVQTSRPLDGPDGLRPTGDGRFVIAENAAGRVSLGTLNGDTLQIDTVKDGFDFPPGVAVHGQTIWVVEMKRKFRADPNADAGVFLATPLALPTKK